MVVKVAMVVMAVMMAVASVRSAPCVWLACGIIELDEIITYVLPLRLCLGGRHLVVVTKGG